MATRNKRSILVVCEGTNTEPDYLGQIDSFLRKAKQGTGTAYLQQLATNNQAHLWDTITIQPDHHVMGGRKPSPPRTGKNIGDADWIFREIYGNDLPKHILEHPNAQPLRYVKEAFKGYDTYDELWAVFDQDNHQYHAEAFELAAQALEGKCVRVAFSSRSFEYWILLHFQRTCFPFQTTTCKDRKKGAIHCGMPEEQHPKNCNGKHCLLGYIRTHTPLQYYTKSNQQTALSKLWAMLLEEKPLTRALENAAWLRWKVSRLPAALPIHQRNPYTDVDVLVKSLLGIQTEYLWAALGEPVAFAGMKSVRIQAEDPHTLLFSAQNISINPYAQQHAFYLKNAQRDKIPLSLLPESSPQGFDKIKQDNCFRLRAPVPLAGNDFCLEAGKTVLMIETEATAL